MDYAQVYGDLHEKNEKYFAGFTMKRYADRITAMVKMTAPRFLLDYGSGKGYQYLLRRYHVKWAEHMSIEAEPFFGRELPYCYDLGVRQLRERPCTVKDCWQTCPAINRKSKQVCERRQVFDGVFSTDMLEHIERGDLSMVLDDALAFLTTDDRPTFAFFSVSCIPADKFLPDGRNVHVTMEPPDWWTPILTAAFEKSKAPQLTMRVCFETAGKALVDREWKRP